MIPQSFIQELLDRTDVVEVVGAHVRLKKTGANFSGLCPFHGEKTPSFTVSPTKQFYHCFGCGAHGSAIGFLMEHLGMGYVEAIESLAQQLGLNVPQTAESPPSAQVDDRKTLFAVMDKASAFYRARLKDSHKAINYLRSRGLEGRTALRFGLGYAPGGWHALEACFADYRSQALVHAGLVIERESDASDALTESAQVAEASRGSEEMPVRRELRDRWDRFRDRIMFPIRNARGQVIGFGGRIVDKGEPKYLNSPETVLFSKGRELYGLYESREGLRRENQVLVVEGYMDVVMLAQHGVDFAVATLGTAASHEHLVKLLKLVDRIIFCFDGDAAGRRAAWKALNTALPLAVDGKRFEFLFLPADQDPDSFVREHGAAGMAKALTGAEALSECLMRELAQTHGEASAEDRSAFMAAAIPLLAQLPLGALRMQLSRELADRVGIGTHEMNLLVQQHVAQSSKRQQPPRPASSADMQDAAASQSKKTRSAYGVNQAQLIAPRHDAIGIAEKALVLMLRFPFVRLQEPSELQVFWPEVLVLAMQVDPTVLGEDEADLAGMSLRLERLCAMDPERWLPWRKTLMRAMAWVLLVDAQEAKTEFQGALIQLADQRIRELIDQLVRDGLHSSSEREHYEALVKQRRLLKAGDVSFS